MLIKNDKPLAAISYDTQTFAQLRKFILSEDGIELIRISPDDFFKNHDNSYQYINLIIQDWDKRHAVSNALDQYNLDRFTYIGDDASSKFNVRGKVSVGLGCMIFPAVWMYSGSIGKDCIMHGLIRMAENVSVGDGCYLSGSITIAGSCTIGNRCYLGNNLFFIDHVSVCDDVRLLPGTNLRKSITKPGTYYNPNTFRVESITL